MRVIFEFDTIDEFVQWRLHGLNTPVEDKHIELHASKDELVKKVREKINQLVTLIGKEAAIDKWLIPNMKRSYGGAASAADLDMTQLAELVVEVEYQIRMGQKD